MKLFVFENVLEDYSSGMAIIAAETLPQAKQFAKEYFSTSYDREEGWKKPTAVYKLEGKVRPGVKEYSYGGG